MKNPERGVYRMNCIMSPALSEDMMKMPDDRFGRLMRRLFRNTFELSMEGNACMVVFKLFENCDYPTPPEFMGDEKVVSVELLRDLCEQLDKAQARIAELEQRLELDDNGVPESGE